MRFLADMGVSQANRRVVTHEWTRRGPSARRGAATLAEWRDFSEGRPRTARIAYAGSFDLDFGEILAASGGQIISVILFRLRNKRTRFLRSIRHFSMTCFAIRAAIVHKELSLIVEDSRHRIADLPHRQLERAWLPPHRRGSNIIRRPSEELPPVPLLDHFHPPLSERRHWHSFHNSWTTYLSSQLNTLLPAGYFRRGECAG